MIATLEYVRRSFGERAVVENRNLELEPGRGGPSPERLLVFQESALMPWLTTLDNAVMILDEPFRGLDALTRRLMQECCAALLEDAPRTTLLITTDVDEAILLADRLLIMADRPTRVIKAEALELRQSSVIVSQMLAGKQQMGEMARP